MTLETLIGRPVAEIPTPSLVVDLDRFEANLEKMAAFCKDHGVNLRPHAKTHKCPAIGRLQVDRGAVGISVATVPEAEAMAAAGLPGILLTSPIVDRGKIARMVALKARGSDVLLAVGDPRAASRIDETAREAAVRIDVLLDLDVGDRRIGIPPESALALAAHIETCKALRLVGIQAYSGLASHIVGFEARSAYSREAVAKAVALKAQLVADGREAVILSVASTGTYNIDAAIPGVTELQCGSYIFGDMDYRRIGGRGGGSRFEDFAPSLSVLATVVCEAYPESVTVDAGIKAFATDVEWVPEIIGRPDLKYRRRGDEFGQVTAAGPGTSLPSLGDLLAFTIPHCDPTVNLYDRLYAARNGRVEAIWAVEARRELGRPATGV